MVRSSDWVKFVLNRPMRSAPGDEFNYNAGNQQLLSAVIGVHLDFHKADAWSKIFIAAAIEVHRLKGPGLLEPIYRKCVRRECERRYIPAQYELLVPIEYKVFVSTC